MKLTGKCKEDFEKWYLNEYLKVKDDDTNIVFMPKSWTFVFYKKNPSEQYGVYVDFFDSVNYNIGIIPHWLNNNTVDRFDFEVKDCIYREYSVTRQEAREQAILKANEIYNSKTEK